MTRDVIPIAPPGTDAPRPHAGKVSPATSLVGTAVILLHLAALALAMTYF